VAISPTGAVPVPLTVFGSWVTEVAPESVPENISPDCQDVAFAPGQVSSRPCTDIVLDSPFPAGGINGFIPTVVYGKSFKLPTGAIQNLYFDSNGSFWVEYLSVTPGEYTLLFTSTPGSTCKSITQFGREFIAISDGLHGTEVPLQWDGTLLRRYTCDGPGAPPTIANLAIAPSQMASTGNTLTRNANLVLANTATPHNLKVGYQAQISNVPDSNSDDVNQTNNSAFQTANIWNFVGTQWRTNDEPINLPLSDLTFNTFGFTIPSAATILGITVSADIVSESPTSGFMSQVGLWFEGASLGTIKTPATPFTTSVVTQSFGSAGDNWGAALTPAIVNNPSFGFAMGVQTDAVRLFIGQPFSMTVFYTLSGSGTVAIVQSIVINNETQPGLALVTTTEPHGLVPGISVSIVGVEPGTVANISNAQWSSGVTTVTTETSHNLTPGSVVQITGVTTATSGTTFSFNGTFAVDTVPTPNEITYSQVPITATDPDVINATGSTGSIVISWPIPDDTPTPTYFNVESAPTPTTFYVQVTYSDGTWLTGTVGFAWEGIFYVTEVLSPTQFQYQQYGPPGSTTAIGTVTPYGQAAPGLHLMQVLWLTDESAIPAPSPPVTIIANGGQYFSVSNIPIGPSYVKGRILAFTGAQPNVPGELPPFFYIPVTPQTEGQIIGTATQINDNTTTSIVLDFSDNTLFAALGISIPGNTLANQIKLDGALGFGVYQSRLQTWGQRNIVNNLLNMGFGGGSSPVAPTLPLGWTVIGSGGVLAPGRFGGQSWNISGMAELSQGFYEDAYGDPIAISSTIYAFRCYLAVITAGALTATISSSSTGFSTSAVIAYTTDGWYEATFSAATPDSIPADLMFSFAGVAGNSSISELSLIDTQTPYTDTILYGAYVNNPEGIDGVSGQWGPEDDPSKVMDIGELRDTLYILTQAPSGRLHETTGSGVTEPSGWQVNEVSADCGILSAISLTHSQADETTASGGDDWMAWPTEGGVAIFGGGEVEKISQEIQPNWYDPTKEDTSVQLNMDAALTVWSLNDPVTRLLMFGVPIGDATAPNKIYVLNYRNLGSASAIAGSPPFHPSFAGKLIATDNSRKWAPWNLPMNGAVRMYRSNGASLTTIMLGGNGQAYGAAPGFGNIYEMNPALFTDEDFGQVFPYYVTYAFLDPEKAQALQLKGLRILLAYLRAYVQGTGFVTFSYYPNSLANIWPLTTIRALTNVFFDREGGGGQCTGDRIFIKIASSPNGGTDNGFVLTRLTAFIKDAKMLVRGAAQ
jgi:hypothetical protein